MNGNSNTNASPFGLPIHTTNFQPAGNGIGGTAAGLSQAQRMRRMTSRRSSKKDYKDLIERACRNYGTTPEEAKFSVKGARKVTYVLDWGRVTSPHCFQTERGESLCIPNGFKVVFEASNYVWIADILYSTPERDQSNVPMYQVYPVTLEGRESQGSGWFMNISAAFRKALAMYYDDDQKDSAYRPNGRLYLGIFYEAGQEEFKRIVRREPHRVAPELRPLFDNWLNGQPLSQTDRPSSSSGSNNQTPAQAGRDILRSGFGFGLFDGPTIPPPNPSSGRPSSMGFRSDQFLDPPQNQYTAHNPEIPPFNTPGRFDSGGLLNFPNPTSTAGAASAFIQHQQHQHHQHQQHANYGHLSSSSSSISQQQQQRASGFAPIKQSFSNSSWWSQAFGPLPDTTSTSASATPVPPPPPRPPSQQQQQQPIKTEPTKKRGLTDHAKLPEHGRRMIQIATSDNLEEMLQKLMEEIQITTKSADSNSTDKLLKMLSEIQKELLNRGKIKRARTNSDQMLASARDAPMDQSMGVGTSHPSSQQQQQLQQQQQSCDVPMPATAQFQERERSSTPQSFGGQLLRGLSNGNLLDFEDMGGDPGNLFADFLDLGDFDTSQQQDKVIVGCHLSHDGLFFQLSSKKTGEVSGEELAKAYTSLRIPASSRIVKATLAAADIDKNGKISHSEFIEFLRKREKELKQMFDAIDTDKDGFIDLTDLRTARDTGELEHGASDEELKALVEWMDSLENAYEDQRIHFEEFRTGMILFPPATTISDVLKHFRENQDVAMPLTLDA